MKLHHHTLTAILIATFAVLPSTAHAGDYWAYLGSDNGQPPISSGSNGFANYSYGGSWWLGGSAVSAYPGYYQAGSYGIIRWWKPAGLQALEGIADGTYATPNSCFRLIIERPGGNPDYVTTYTGDGSWSAGWGSVGTYLDFQMETTCATTAADTRNHFWLNDFKVKLRDTDAPQLASLDAGTGWQGPGCRTIRYQWSDQGSGVWNAALQNITTGQTAYAWQQTMSQTMVQPGLTDPSFAPCVTVAASGTYTFRVSATDYTGISNATDFTAKFDLTPPTITPPTLHGTPVADDVVLNGDSYRPPIVWDVTDVHSGLATIQTTLDGSTIGNTISGNIVTLVPGANLPLGSHNLKLTAVDAVGNQSTITRRITIADSTAPTIDINLPSAIGGNTPTLDASAADDYSGVDTSTWTVTVNGSPLLGANGSTRIRDELGYLANGTHTIVVSVSDLSGNTSTTTLHYTALSPDGSGILPGVTGIFLLDTPTTVDEGEIARVEAAAVRDGRPLEGMRAELHQNGKTIAGKPISTNGTVDMGVKITEPGPITLTVDGSGLADQTINFTFRRKTVATAVAGAAATPKPVPATIVKRVIDGDTFVLKDGRTVRLLQVDAPESNECYGGRATNALRAILKPGTRVRLVADANLDKIDKYGRLLRYVFVGKRNVNRELARAGTVTPYFVNGAKGRIARNLLADTRLARKAGRGLWQSCPGTKLTVRKGAQTGAS